jgi:putative hydrolase of the HAD superfamily
MAAHPFAALAFDLGNVLVRVDHLRFCRRLADLAGVSPETAYDRIFASDLEPAFDTGRLSPQAFHRRVLDLFGVALPFPEFCRSWCEIFDPMPGMAEVVARLKGRLPLFLVSNTNALHFPYIWERYPLIHDFTGYILSYQTGSRKPEPAFYRMLLQKAACPPAACLFIDDKLPFVEAARAHGLTAWQFTGPEDFTRDLRDQGLL